MYNGKWELELCFSQRIEPSVSKKKKYIYIWKQAIFHYLYFNLYLIIIIILFCFVLASRRQKIYRRNSTWTCLPICVSIHIYLPVSISLPLFARVSSGYHGVVVWTIFPMIGLHWGRFSFLSGHCAIALQCLRWLKIFVPSPNQNKTKRTKRRQKKEKAMSIKGNNLMKTKG